MSVASFVQLSASSSTSSFERKGILLVMLFDLSLQCIFYSTYRLIRLNSPNLNYLIICGAVMIFISDVLFVIPTLNPFTVSITCIVSYSKLTVSK